MSDTQTLQRKQYQRRTPARFNGSAISAPLDRSDYPAHDLVVDGHTIPYISARDCTANWAVFEQPSGELDTAWAAESLRLRKSVEEGERIFNLTLDNRFGVTVTERELEHWAWFLANAMAISAGYTSHGEHSRPINRHGPSRI